MDDTTAPETPVSPQPEDPLAGVPELKTYMVDNDDEKISALKLTADSIAQMRQSANSALIYSPINLSIIVAILALAARYMRDAGFDNAIIGTTGAGLVMCTLAIFRWFTQGYLFAAEAMKWDWLGDADVIVTKFGDEIIGTVIIDWISGESRQKKRKAWRGEVKAWTVRLKYRHKGVGTALLEEAVKEAKKKGAETLEFAEEHASKFYSVIVCGEVLVMVKLTCLFVQIRRESSMTFIIRGLIIVRRRAGRCCRICLRPVL